MYDLDTLAYLNNQVALGLRPPVPVTHDVPWVENHNTWEVAQRLWEAGHKEDPHLRDQAGSDIVEYVLRAQALVKEMKNVS